MVEVGVFILCLAITAYIIMLTITKYNEEKIMVDEYHKKQEEEKNKTKKESEPKVEIQEQTEMSPFELAGKIARGEIDIDKELNNESK